MIVLITPTGGRERQFNLCVRWMRNQTYEGRVLWIVVDDCSPTTTEILRSDFRRKWTIIKKYPKPSWKLGDNTQGRNLRTALSVIKVMPKDWIEGIFIIEDDDYYKPEYLDVMVEKLKGFDVVGQSNSTYYNIRTNVFKIHQNGENLLGSLFETGFSVDLLSLFEEATYEKWIDVVFWRLCSQKGKRLNLFSNDKLSIGMKGMPGRKGIGIGHRLNKNSSKIETDENGIVLQHLLGNDHKYYYDERYGYKI